MTIQKTIRPCEFMDSTIELSDVDFGTEIVQDIENGESPKIFDKSPAINKQEASIIISNDDKNEEDKERRLETKPTMDVLDQPGKFAIQVSSS